MSGLAGTGKSKIADVLVKNHGFVAVAFADPLKRIAKDIYDFTDEQLWGESSKRSEPDKRYPREHTFNHTPPNSQCRCCGSYIGDDVQCYLTVRYAIQELGTSWGRGCYESTWTDYAIRVAENLMNGYYAYDAKVGLRLVLGRFVRGVVLTDARFRNELEAGSNAGAKTVRIKRDGFENPRWEHVSETEQMEIPDKDFSYILNNHGSIENIDISVDEMLSKLTKK